uniref:Uncharacterized protein n=1 Tax=Pyrodinium bahamense TaxID=73915 RepID=A0A7S0F9X3_9DINO
MDGDRMNTKTEDGSRACAAYLEALDDAAMALCAEKAPRSYREYFTVNYRALFPDEARNYRVDVLEAAFEQYAVIWVNGDKFEFSTEAMRRAESLQRSWWELGAILERWSQATHKPKLMTARPTRSELRNALVAVDFAWTSFEHKYIYELIAIEEKARRLLVQAIEQEQCVHTSEVQHKDPVALQQLPEYREGQRLLVACVAHLNSVANVSRKGRDDLSVSVLFDALSTLRRCESTEGECNEDAENLRAARILATDVVESYQAMRVYLREVQNCLERVDPHLCNNAGLVARLVDWEESWEMGTRYMQNERLLTAVCGLVAEVRAAQRLAPVLATMCEDCDVELFLVLPRILWLCFLAKPKQYEELVRSLLPHRFSEVKGTFKEFECDAKLKAFIQTFLRAEQLLVGAQAEGTEACNACPAAVERAAWETIVRRVALGDGVQDTLYDGLVVPEKRKEAQAVVEDLMRAVEPWSIEVQRHCPEDWNQCSAVLVQCLTRGAREQKEMPFHV